MEINRHYKLFKKGKNWCTMALTTLAVITGVTLITTQNANADSVSDNNDATGQLQKNTVVQDSNNSSIQFVDNNQSSNQENNSAALKVDNDNSKFDENTNNQDVDTNSNIQNSDAQSSTVNTLDTSKINTNDVNKFSLSLYQTSNDGWHGNQYYRDGQSLKNTTAEIDGNTYYFDENGDMVKDYFLTQNGNDYYFDENGKMAKDYFLNRWGANYYYGLDGARYTNQFFSRWGATYYYGDGGVRYTDQFMHRWGADYYFGNDGALYKNQFFSRWGATYYYGNDGIRWDNRFMSAWGDIYYFGNGGALVKNNTINLGFGDLTFNEDGILRDSNLFIGSVVNGAIRGWTDHQILPSLTIAQAIIESGWGRSTLSSNYHNLFGIKGSYNGQSVNMPTYEDYGSGLVLINDAFRAYPDNDASIQDHTNFLVDNSRYHNLIGVRDAGTATYLIRADGYATATNYTSTLMNTINAYDLTRFDQVAFRAESI